MKVPDKIAEEQARVVRSNGNSPKV